jgi:hypothetical protein
VLWRRPYVSVHENEVTHEADHRTPTERSETSRQADSRSNRSATPCDLVYDKRCRIGGTLTLDDLAETAEIGDWKMPDFRAACSFAASQGWLIVKDDALTLTTVGLAAA